MTMRTWIFGTVLALAGAFGGCAGDTEGSDCATASDCDDGQICAAAAVCDGDGECFGICGVECADDTDCDGDAVCTALAGGDSICQSSRAPGG